MVNYCPNCGKQVSHEDIFCPVCGTRLDGNGASATAGTESGKTGTPSRTPHATILGLTEVFTGFWVIIALATGLALLLFTSIDMDGLEYVIGTGGVAFILSALFAAVAAWNIKNRKGHLIAIICLLLSGLCLLPSVCLVIAVVFAIMVYISKEDFQS